MMRLFSIRSTSILPGFCLGVFALSVACAPSIEEVDCTENPDSTVCQPTDNFEASPPRLYADPPFGVSFNCVTIGCEETRTLTLENRGGGTVALAQIGLTTVSETNDFLLLLVTTDEAGVESVVEFPTSDAPYLLATGKSVQLQVRYRPTDGQEDAGTLTIDWFNGRLTYDEAAVEHLELSVSARVLGNASANLLSNTLNFGYVDEGDRGTRFLEIENTSTTDVVLSVSSIALTEQSSANFTIGAGWADNANPGERIRIPIYFDPDSVGAFDGALSLVLNDAAGPYTIALLGTAIDTASVVVLDPQSTLLNFGTVVSGQDATRSVRIRNEGGQIATVTPELVTGTSDGFSISGETLSIGVMEEATFDVSIAPPRGGDLQGELRIAADEAPGSPTSLTLTAVCSAPQAVVNTAAIDFGTLVQGWTAEPQVVTISHSGTGNLIVHALEFDVGSSTQIQRVGDLTLPAVIGPGDPSLEIPVTAVGTALGSLTATLLVHTNSVVGQTVRVDISGSVVSCEEGCPVANGIPDCRSGTCEILRCNGGWHNTDAEIATGCECQEERNGNDTGGVCTTGSDLGNLGDSCSDHPGQKLVEGNLHDADDIDLFFVRTDDVGCTSDFFGDSAETSVEIVSGPPGLALCAVIRDAETGCGGYTDFYDPTLCGNGRYGISGSYGSEDDYDLTAWVMWAPGAAPSCGTYTLRFRGEE